jgi:hypothetical protein
LERKQEQERIVAQFEKRAPAEELPPAYEYKKNTAGNFRQYFSAKSD